MNKTVQIKQTKVGKPLKTEKQDENRLVGGYTFTKSKMATRSTAALGNITNVPKDRQRRKYTKQQNGTKGLGVLKPTKVSKKREIEFEDSITYDEDAMVIEDVADIQECIPTPIDYIDIDADDADDPQNVAKYVNDIFEHCFATETKYMARCDYFQNQSEITEKMRAILIDWMLEVHLKFRLLPETMFLAVNLIDRFLERVDVKKSQLQLVGMACLFIASKYEEIYPPECRDFVYIADNAYTREEIFEMEQKILNVLDFALTAPTSLYFLRRFSKAAHSDYKTHTLCKYIIELSLLDLKMLQYKPSEVASASVLLARIMTKQQTLWTPTLEHYTTYRMDNLESCVRDQARLVDQCQHGKLQAAFRKYSHQKFDEVATILVPPGLLE